MVEVQFINFRILALLKRAQKNKMKSELIFHYKRLIPNLIECDNKGKGEKQQIVENLQMIKFMEQQCPSPESEMQYTYFLEKQLL